MRQIKLRGWDNWTNKMYYPGDKSLEVDFGTNGEILLIVGNHLLVKMQFTGHFDKNGKEIYEGDLVTKDNHVVLVRFNELYGGFYFYATERPKTATEIILCGKLLPGVRELTDNREDARNLTDARLKTYESVSKMINIEKAISHPLDNMIVSELFEIIGNIYENPELLKN